MATGERIKFFRTRMKLTQRYLGVLLGFNGKTSDVRMAQYESEARMPKADLIEKLSCVFDISPQALTVPDIDSLNGLIHTLFVLEDRYGLRADRIDGKICLTLDKEVTSEYSDLSAFLSFWEKKYKQYQSGQITNEEYDYIRYTYPRCNIRAGTLHRRESKFNMDLDDIPNKLMCKK